MAICIDSSNYNNMIAFTIPLTPTADKTVSALHSGQAIELGRELVLCNFSKHLSQYVCRQCSERGSVNVSMHIGQINSPRATSTSLLSFSI